MAPDEYTKALDKALSDLSSRVQTRDLLNAEIAGLRETVRVLSTLVQMPTDKQQQIAKLLAMADYATPSLTNAIRSLLARESPKEMTAIEVRNALDESSNSDDSNSLSACHAALKRMLSDGEVELGPMKNGKASYRRVLKLNPPPALSNLETLHAILSEQPGRRMRLSLKTVTHPVDQLKPKPTPGELKRQMEELLNRKPK